MKIFTEQSIADFEAWSGAKETKQVIIDNDKEAEFDMLIERFYPDGIDETGLNDILWFESDWVYEMLGISEEEEEEEEEDEE